jgi:hypothetical protein
MSSLLDPDLSRGEIGWGRPVLWQEAQGASLIISRRAETGYELQQARMEAGALHWRTLLHGPTEEWESSMTCFGAPCSTGDWEYLFYNGNQFGRSGFGLARRSARDTGGSTATPLLAALRSAARR